MSYSSTIQTFRPLTFDDIIRTAKQYVPDTYKHCPWRYPGLEHGTALLDNEDQLCCYLAAYGEMHKGKLECAISKFPFKNINCNYEIIDWGCGQGIASIYMIDSLRKNGLLDKLQKISLIEPSATALARAKMNVSIATENNIFIEGLNYLLPANVMPSNGETLNGIHIEEV